MSLPANTQNPSTPLTAVVCPTDILAFSKALPKFATLETEINFVSTDTQYTHKAWIEADPADGGISSAFKLTLVSTDLTLDNRDRKLADHR